MNWAKYIWLYPLGFMVGALTEKINNIWFSLGFITLTGIPIAVILIKDGIKEGSKK